MMIRVYGLDVRSRPAAIALAAVALAVGAVFVAFGIFLLLGLAVVATIVGAGMVLVRSLTRRGTGRLEPPPSANRELDPALEVFPESTLQVPARPAARSHDHKPD